MINIRVRNNNNRKAKNMGKLNFDKFMQLAKNSYGVKKYSRAADNCRLAAEYAFNQNNITGAAEAYQLWIKSLLMLKKSAEVKKICCNARSKFGNHLDLVYYEYLSALDNGDMEIAAKLGREFLEISREITGDENTIFIESLDKLDEVSQCLDQLQRNQQASRQIVNRES